LNKEERFSPPVTGGISLLAAFAVLCLTVFALLALSTVKAQSRLADVSLGAIADYYTADEEALRILAMLCSGEMPEGVVVTDDIYAYSCPVSEAQRLEVEVRILEDSYKVIRWQVVSESQDMGDMNLELWDGDGLF
jgi:hypothetical protein